MEKKLMLFIVALMALACVFGVIGCGKTPSNSESSSDKWYEIHTHYYTQTVVEPTCTKSGFTLYECFCSDTYKDNETPINPNNHSYDENGRCKFCNHTVEFSYGVLYDLSSDKTYAEVVGYTGTTANVIIASTYENLPVKSISKEAFKGSTILLSVVIPEGVVSIGDSAFQDCGKLTSVIIPESVTSIGDAVFADCNKLTSITIPDKVTSISRDTFNGCTALTSIKIGKGVTSIGEYAFKYCISLTSITIGENVMNIGSGAFTSCVRLTSITIDENVTSIGTEAFYECYSLSDVYYTGTIDQWVQIDFNDGYSNPLCYVGNLYINNKLLTKANITTATKIEDYAFSNCSKLTSITISNVVTSIGSGAFSGCTELKNITISDSVTSIGGGAFSGCTELKNITIPDKVTSISWDTFNGCTTLTSVTMSEAVTSIDDYAFCGCTGLKSITIGKGVTSIGFAAFRGCLGLISVTIPEAVTSIDGYAFYNCPKLIEVYNKSTLNITSGSNEYGYVGYYAKAIYTEPYTSKLSTVNDYLLYTDEDNKILVGYVGNETNLVLPNSITEIYRYAFYGCDRITNVTISDGVKSIGEHAFYGCTGITSIIIPDSVVSIGNAAFKDCNWITSITCPSFAISHLPTTYLQTATITSGETIDDFAFSNCPELKSVVIPETVTSIGSGAFSCCTNLRSITIPNAVTSIGNQAFILCANLTSITIPNAVTSIGSNAFLECFKLVEVYNKSPLNITAGSSEHGYVGYYAKAVYTKPYTSKLSTVNDYVMYTDGDNKILVGYIGNETNLILPEGITEIYQYALYNCYGPTSITIPETVTSIGDYALYWCGIISVTFGSGVTSIGDYAFSNCGRLTSVYFKGTEAEWNAISVDQGNYELTNATRYYYSETAPTGSGNYWHYDGNGNIVVWKKQ